MHLRCWGNSAQLAGSTAAFLPWVRIMLRKRYVTVGWPWSVHPWFGLGTCHCKLLQAPSGCWGLGRSLEHECPAFWLGWAALSEEEVFQAAYKIYKIVNICK